MPVKKAVSLRKINGFMEVGDIIAIHPTLYEKDTIIVNPIYSYYIEVDGKRPVRRVEPLMLIPPTIAPAGSLRGIELENLLTGARMIDGSYEPLANRFRLLDE